MSRAVAISSGEQLRVAATLASGQGTAHAQVGSRLVCALDPGGIRLHSSSVHGPLSPATAHAHVVAYNNSRRGSGARRAPAQAPTTVVTGKSRHHARRGASEPRRATWTPRPC